MKAGKYSINISNRDKILFPEDKITKGDIIDYYDRMSGYLLPHIKNRPVMLQRFPDGIGKNGFYQKDASDYFPHWIELAKVKKKDGFVHHAVCNKKADLIYLANQACISLHIWLSKKNKIHYPDKLIIDLDPDSDDYRMVKEGALIIKKHCNQKNIPLFLMNTGSKGVHMIIPLDGSAKFKQVHSVAENFCRKLHQKHSDLFTLETFKKNREGLIFLDYQRNNYSMTGIAPYCLRPKKGAPVATPLDWKEFKRDAFNPSRYHIKNIFKRLSRKDDPWKNLYRHKIPYKKLKDLIRL